MYSVVRILAVPVLSTILLAAASPQAVERTDELSGAKSGFDNIFSALADVATRAKGTFSEALLPGNEERVGRSGSLFERFYERFAKKPAPEVAAQLLALERFTQPQLLQITQGMNRPFKRSPQLSGYSYPKPDNPLVLPEKLQELPRKSSETQTQRFAGKLVLKEVTPKPSFQETISATARSFQVDRDDTIIRASPITISSTPGNFRIIQEIQIRSTGAPKVINKNKNQRFQSNQSPKPIIRQFPNSSPLPFTSSSRPSQPKLPRIPKQQSPALTFTDNALVAVLGRQVAGKPVEGFPNGLPDFTPKGVRITLENMFGPSGEMIMNPIPGEAGTDYPVFSSVPDTGFNCAQQDFPGIYADTQADCQVFYMCQPNGASTGFLCPNGTIFNQQYFVCDWWYNLDCSQQQNFYSLNQFIYQDVERQDDDQDFK